MKTKDIQISVKKTGYGNYDVTLYENYEIKGTFHTTDSQLIDDIDEMNSDGFEHKLLSHDTFEEVVKTCLTYLK